MHAAAQLWIVVLAYDVWFYYFHRLLHTSWLYAYHRKHHEYKRNVCARATFHADRLENALSAAGVLVPLVAVPGVELPAVVAGSLLCGIMGIIHHDPHLVTLPGLRWVFDEHHIRHHTHPVGNYGRYWIDYLHGTVIGSQPQTGT